MEDSVLINGKLYPVASVVRDEIERLKKQCAAEVRIASNRNDEIERLRAALERIVDDWEKGRDPINKSVDYPVDIAREALRDE